jgi:cytochrome c
MAAASVRVLGAAAAAAALALGALSALAQGLAGDPAKGKDVFEDRCGDCHVLDGVGQGPNLVGVIGRRAGSLPGYDYTDAIKASGLTWTPAELDRFLQGPKQLVPGTAMQVIVPDPAQRRDLIAYLASLRPGKS